MSDIFHEVDEAVRREKLKQLWERHSNLIVAAALAVVLAVGGWRGYEWWDTKKSAESGAAFEAAVMLTESGKQAEAQAAFAKLAKEGSSGYRILAGFREAAELAKADPAGAVKAYDALAADSSLGRPLQDRKSLVKHELHEIPTLGHASDFAAPSGAKARCVEDMVTLV